jgi:hypothetical protein
MIIKICVRCAIEKELTEFSKQKKGKLGTTSDCKECRRKIGKEYYKKNKKKVNKKHNDYYQHNKKKLLKLNKNHHKKHKAKFPWKYIFKNIKDRCTNKNRSHYKYYGGRGIKCLITELEVKFLWFRDKAYLMVKPSIDRINNNGDYCIENCRFLPMKEHQLKDKKKQIIQFDLQGKFIREWDSLKEAGESLSISGGDLSNCLHGKFKQMGGFKWKFKN